MEPKQVHKPSTLRPDETANSLLSHLLLTTPSKNASEELRTEYDELRKQIAQNSTLSLQVIGVILVLTGALITVAFSKEPNIPHKWLLFIVVETIAFIGLRQNTNRLNNTYMIASYIKTFIEPQTKYMKWETRLTEFRNKNVKYRGSGFFTQLMWIYGIIILGNFSLASYFFLQEYHSAILVIIALVITMLIFLQQWYICILIAKKRTERYDIAWQEIRDAENRKQ